MMLGMMIAIGAQLAHPAAPAPVPQLVVDPAPPVKTAPGRPIAIDWDALTPLPYRAPPTITPAMLQFVAGEIAAKHCASPRAADGRYSVKVDVAVLVDPAGAITQTVPRAIQCPTIEQYSAGVVSSFARDNVVPPPLATARWYRATLNYDWTG